MSEKAGHESICPVCGDLHPQDATGLESCPIVKKAALADARPKGVPPRVYGGYFEARAALRARKPMVATQELRQLLSCVSQEYHVPPRLSFAKKLQRLCDEDVISRRMQKALLDHVFFRSYLKGGF